MIIRIHFWREVLSRRWSVLIHGRKSEIILIKNDRIRDTKNSKIKYTNGGGIPGGIFAYGGGTTGGGTDKSGVKFFLLYSLRSAVIT